ncbi:hypothetical protein [Nesterenkonia sp. F]|uniref:hypothetical protein n=1 Tax=Nesterenkonia sp. F TaxID=795955 RepID=UPI000255D28D|nr:hypothetical protein [Nesterenkonia sp. F]
MSHGDWVPVTRHDGETVGHLEPLTDDWSAVRPRTVLGHPAGDAMEFIPAEELLLDRGLGELLEPWTLTTEDGTVEDLTIIEVAPRGIRLADRTATKALAATEEFVVAWPDLDRRLSRRTSR